MIGPLIDMKAVEKVEAQIADAVRRARRWSPAASAPRSGGSFLSRPCWPTYHRRGVAEETFGPLAPLFRFNDEAEPVKVANDTEFGLAAYFYSCDIGRIWCVAEALE